MYTTLIGPVSNDYHLAREISERLCSYPYNPHPDINADLARRLQGVLVKYIRALRWCGEHSDFDTNGRFEKEWNFACAPLLGVSIQAIGDLIGMSCDEINQEVAKGENNDK